MFDSCLNLGLELHKRKTRLNSSMILMTAAAETKKPKFKLRTEHQNQTKHNATHGLLNSKVQRIPVRRMYATRLLQGSVCHWPHIAAAPRWWCSSSVAADPLWLRTATVLTGLDQPRTTTSSTWDGKIPEVVGWTFFLQVQLQVLACHVRSSVSFDARVARRVGVENYQVRTKAAI